MMRLDEREAARIERLADVCNLSDEEIAHVRRMPARDRQAIADMILGSHERAGRELTEELRR